ncbi:hypothetical protein [Streptomyces sp. NPDC091268]|uniref:hypothetical protein n=1 Tax=Streptomyces sp. NPDC091268 TaxID=3365979 RepID=UPI00382B3E09
MAKNKNQKLPQKQQATRSPQDISKGSMESSPEPASSGPTPMDMARKGKSKRFGHN